PNTVVVPYDLVAKPLFDERRAIGPARVQRYFLKAATSGATLSAAVTLPDSAVQTATAYLFEPNGAPFRGVGHDSVASRGGTRRPSRERDGAGPRLGGPGDRGRGDGARAVGRLHRFRRHRLRLDRATGRAGRAQLCLRAARRRCAGAGRPQGAPAHRGAVPRV